MTVEGYETVITGDANQGFLITNSHTPEEPPVVIPQTGEGQKPILWIALCFTSLAGILLTIQEKRRKTEQT